MRKQYYEYRHVVGYEETNLVGDVYHANYVRWQGRCREMFLLEHAPAVLDELSGDLSLLTVEAECEPLGEVAPRDEVAIRMRMEDLAQTQIGFAFDYFRVRENGEELIARGRHRVTCVREVDGDSTPAHVPAQLGAALGAYAVVPITYPVVAGTGGRA